MPAEPAAFVMKVASCYPAANQYLQVVAMSSHNTFPHSVVVIGAGPAGLMAAEVLSQGGVKVEVFDAMPSVGRKFLMAGKGGMNITHAEPLDAFISRYGKRHPQMAALLDALSPQALRDWIHALGIETFVGSSRRVFPTDMKAAPLLRAWLHRLRESGVSFHMRHRWLGWADHAHDHNQPSLNPLRQHQLRFATPEAEKLFKADAVVLALGGGSWAQLGSDGAWVPLLEQRGVSVAALKPANSGFDIGWSTHFSTRFAGQHLKTIALSYTDKDEIEHHRPGELMITATGVEGSLIYAFSAGLRDKIAASGEALIYLDLLPGKDKQQVINDIAHPRGSKSMASHLQSRLGIKGVKAGLLREVLTAQDFSDPYRLGSTIKSLPLALKATRPLNEAISSAGGVMFEDVNQNLMLSKLPGVFCAGEMLDWEAPTGGYLLTGCFASGKVAGLGALAWLGKHSAQLATLNR